MKKGMKVLVAVLAVTTIVFCNLWIRAVTGHYSEMEETCQRYAEQAVGSLADYADLKDINDESYIAQYWGAVARFYAFKESLYSLPDDDGGRNEARYKICDGVYDFMLMAPEKVLSNLDEVLVLMEPVGEDFDNPTAWDALNELSYNLQYVWE